MQEKIESIYFINNYYFLLQLFNPSKMAPREMSREMSENWKHADDFRFSSMRSCASTHEMKCAKIWKLATKCVEPSLGWYAVLEKEQPEKMALLRSRLTMIDWGGNLDEVRKVINGESALTAELPEEVREFARSPSCDVKYFAYYMAYWATYLVQM